MRARSKRSLLGWLVLALLVGALVGRWAGMRHTSHPDAMTLVREVREVARLEALEVTLYKKVTYEPDPQGADSLWGELLSWAQHSLREPRGKAIVFARVSLSYDFAGMQLESFQLDGDRVTVRLPPLMARVELLPDETEVVGSNLNSAETAHLFALAKTGFEAQVLADRGLQARAQRSAESTLRAFLLGAGYRNVVFESESPAVMLPAAR